MKAPKQCQVVVVPGGPALVRGADVVLDEDGNPHDVERSVVAVCLCGLTQRAPWCDATHKVNPDRPTDSNRRRAAPAPRDPGRCAAR